jgi:hypothetical protein
MSRTEGGGIGRGHGPPAQFPEKKKKKKKKIILWKKILKILKK